jgi:two-component system sensor histidine kinase/response regulator
MDIQMPKMDGLEATRLIRCLPGRANVPIVALTANVFPEDVARYLEAGMNGHIAKPIVVKDLYKTMLDWLRAEEVGVPVLNSTALSVNPPPTDSLMARLAAIPGLDPEVGLNSLAGKEASYIRLLGKFAERQSAEMADLNRAMAEGDLATAKRIAHTLKGLSGTMGAALLQASAQRLDGAIRENLGAEEINRLGGIVVGEYSALAGAILAEMAV